MAEKNSWLHYLAGIRPTTNYIKIKSWLVNFYPPYAVSKNQTKNQMKILTRIFCKIIRLQVDWMFD